MNPAPNEPRPDDSDLTAKNDDPTVDVRPDSNDKLDRKNGESDDLGESSEARAASEKKDLATESVKRETGPEPSSEPTRQDEIAPRLSRDTDPLSDATLAPSQTGRPRQTANIDDPTFFSEGRLVDGSRASQASHKHGKIVEELPKSIGRYEIIRLLGEGAFGRVYESHDPQLDRRVAIKVAKPLSRQTQVKRFLREARAAAQLRHPTIIPVYEYGQVDGENIIVYEFVRGETLKSYIARKRKISMRETLGIIRRIAEGLHYAHEQGIIHRDIKPENVLIDHDGRPHIADFGCARSIDDQTNLTVDGSILGTPMYMSPEQAGGNSNLADGRTDIWSLGVMLYEMVSGQRPFHGKLTELLQRICHDDARPLRAVQPAAPIDIETICTKCLARDLNQRFSSAQLLADEIERFEKGQPILSRRIGPVRRTWMWAKRNQAVATLLLTIAVTLIVGTIVSSTFAIQAYREQKNRAMAQLNSLTTSRPEKLPEIFQSLMPFRATVLPRLKRLLAEGNQNRKEEHRVRMAILELENNEEVRGQMADEMVEYLLTSDAGDFSVCRMCLRFRKTALTNKLWTTALDIANSNSDRRFRAAAALALYDPESPNWELIAPEVGGYLTALNQMEMSYWMDSLDSLILVRHWLKPTLVEEFLEPVDKADPTPIRAAAVISLMYTDQVGVLVDLIPKASAQQLPLLTDALKIHQTKAAVQLRKILESLESIPQRGSALIRQQANLNTALIHLGDSKPWKQFESNSDTSVSTDLIERLGPASVRSEILLQQIQQWKSNDPRLLSAILLSLGQFKLNQLPVTQRENLLPTLLEIFSNHPHARVHSSARWLVSHWNFGSALETAERRLQRSTPESEKDWHVDLSGNTFAILGPVDQFRMGLDPNTIDQPEFDAADVFDEPLHLKRIPRRFGVCILEVTIEQFERFEAELMAQLISQLGQMDDTVVPREKKRLRLRIENMERVRNRRVGLDKNLPVGDIDYFTALSYCRWLSEEQQLESGLPTVEQLRQIYEARTDFQLKQANLDPTGYRLPTASEWEFACRRDSHTLFPFGRSAEFASRYAWFATNSATRLHPVGQLKPGNSGLFDVLGNTSEWCLDWYQEAFPAREGLTEQDVFVDFDAASLLQSPRREYRGGSFADEILDLRSSKRFSLSPTSGLPRVGFRLARTYAPSTKVLLKSDTLKSKKEKGAAKVHQ